MKTILIAMILAGAMLATPSSLHARPRVSPVGQVVHSRRGPVAMHRVLPPFRGQHVYDPGR